MKNTWVVIAAIIAFLLWLLSKKKGVGTMFGDQTKTDTKETPKDGTFIGGGGAFGGGGSSGSWLMNQNISSLPVAAKTTPANSSSVGLVQKKSPVVAVNPLPSIASPAKISVRDMSIAPAVMPVKVNTVVSVPAIIKDSPVISPPNNILIKPNVTPVSALLPSKTAQPVLVAKPAVVPMEKVVKGTEVLNSRLIPQML